MLNSWLDYEEQSALEAICRFHGATDPALIAHLAEFCNWVTACERAKFNRSGQPPLLIAQLSSMGIYGGDALTPETT